MAKKPTGEQRPGILRVGTSNIVVPGNRQSFPLDFRGKSRLTYYSSLFNTLEVNSTFKKIPMAGTVERWWREVPDDFQFTLKLLREITHVKDLKTDLQHIDSFLRVAEQMGSKKGCLLIQFPGKITFDYYSQVEAIMERLSALDNNSWRKAVEFRSRTWYVGETSELLHEHGASIVMHDMHKSGNLDACYDFPFYYYRFHGPTGDYRGNYNDTFLKEQAAQMHRLLQAGKDVYAYFNNTMGNAFENAMTLKRMLEV